MIDFHSSVPINSDLIQPPRSTKNQNPTLLFSARPNLQELPFLNKLKVVRELLIYLKNEKLRKSLYVVTEKCEKVESQAIEIFRHEKAKLSVMDLISEECKFEELSNTIQSNINRQSISPIPNVKNQETKKQTGEFELINEISEPEKQQKKVKSPEISSILSRKNRIASDLNQLGHQLEETYCEVEQLEKIFETLCNFYSQNRSIVDTNLKLKQQRDLIQEKIQEYQAKIFSNQREEIILNDKMEDFLEWYQHTIAVYVKDVVDYNNELYSINRKIQTINETNLSQKETISIQVSKQEKKESYSSDSEDKEIEGKTFEINLKFRNLKTELERIKADKKAAAQNKNKQKKTKNQPNQPNNFSKLYVSEIYTL